MSPVIYQEKPADQLTDKLTAATIPALNGIRGISAGMVVLAHLGLLPRVFGALGVSVFFVLSGFLITWLLVRESDQTGRISLKDFYMRRTIRIFPAFYVFCIVTAIAAWAAGISLDRTQFIASLFYMGDYASAILVGGPVIGIAWSLGVEEKFYLWWPWVFSHHRLDFRRLLNIAIAVMAACWLYRILVWKIFDPSPNYLRYAFESRLDNIMVGCLLALALRSGALASVFRVLLGHAAVPLLLSISLLASIFAQETLGAAYEYYIGYTLHAVLIACILIGAVAFSDRPMWRWLEWPVMRWLGKISYSTYLYHAICLALVHELAIKQRWSVQLILGAVTSYTAAWLSYRYVEQPFLRLKKRFETTARHAAHG